ncbi:hypothetical protein [Candidatus Anaplasma sp. TIGMIC]|nr:hypothetical protein [Candidatus Anaplasma sp. TIGMIC]MDB1135329.1 hypothetical protein [Candidatus Anaplasma sp. TIGMIC]
MAGMVGIDLRSPLSLVWYRGVYVPLAVELLERMDTLPGSCPVAALLPL